MKKVLIGVGIGCGVLVLIAVAVMVAGGVWLKGKTEGLVASGEQMQKMETRAKELNQEFAFTPPPRGEPVKLTEARLQDYLEVRQAITPVIQKYEAEGKKFEDLKNQQNVGLGDAMKAGTALFSMMGDIQQAWLAALEEQKMSPKEFHAISAAIFTADIGKSAGEMKKGQRQMLEQVKTAMEQQANNPQMPQEARDEAKKQIAELERQIAALPPADEAPSKATEIHAANSALFAKYKEQYEQQGNPGIDVLLWGQDGNSFAEAMEAANSDMFGAGAMGDAPAGEEMPAEEEPVE